MAYKVALKSPRGLCYLSYESESESKTMKPGKDIHKWVSELFYENKSPWTSWIVYNDEPGHENQNIHHTCQGHCKGILAWNDSEIGWLIHSVPKFPEYFVPNSETKTRISLIESSQQKYGQSFLWLFKRYDNFEECKEFTGNVLKQVLSMSPLIYLSHGFDMEMMIWKKNPLFEIEKLEWDNGMEHYAKNPHTILDFYETLISELSVNLGCKVETWMRGDMVPETEKVKHVQKVSGCFMDEDGEISEYEYDETQDHSKWAVSFTSTEKITNIITSSMLKVEIPNTVEYKRTWKKWFESLWCCCFSKKFRNSVNEHGLILGMTKPVSVAVTETHVDIDTKPKHWILIGDLNRMHSQWKRGGGGMVIYDEKLWKAMNELIIA